MGLFKEKLTLPQQLNDQCRRIRSETRQIERTITRVQNEQKKTEMEIKKAAKSNDKEIIRILAKSLILSRRHVSKLYTTRAQMSSLELQLKENISQAKITKSVKCSTEVLKILNSLVNLPELHNTMTELSNEMVKMGMIEEMTTDAIDSATQMDELDEVVETELNSVLNEILLSSKSIAVKAPPAAASSSSSVAAPSGVNVLRNVSIEKQATKNSQTNINDEERLRQLLSK